MEYASYCATTLRSSCKFTYESDGADKVGVGGTMVYVPDAFICELTLNGAPVWGSKFICKFAMGGTLGSTIISKVT